MGFENEIGNLRKICREIVLPANKIKNIIIQTVDMNRIKQIIDMGSGTLYWSEWYANYVDSVYAVDLIYKDNEYGVGNNKNIYKFRDINTLLAQGDIISNNTLFWMCDVLHHLESDYADELIDFCCMRNLDYIVIKDINKWRKIGNYMNKVHDRIFNNAIIHDVDPYSIMSKLKNSNYQIEYHEFYRLWYPHFLIIAKKKL